MLKLAVALTVVFSFLTVSGAAISAPKVEIVMPSSAQTIEPIVYSTDERYRVVAIGNTIQLWLADGDRLIRRFVGLPSFAKAPAISADSKFVAAASDGDIIIWDSATGNIHRKIKSGLNEVDTIVFSPDGRRLIYAGDHADGPIGQARPVYFSREIESGRVVASQSASIESGQAVNVSADGRVVALGMFNGTVRVSHDGGSSFVSLDARVGKLWSLDMTADGRLLAVGGERGLSLIRLPDGTVTQLRSEYTWRVALSKDGGVVAASEFDTKKVRLIDLRTSETKEFINEPHSIYGLTLIRSGAELIVNGDKRVDVKDPKRISPIGASMWMAPVSTHASQLPNILIGGATTEKSFTFNAAEGTFGVEFADQLKPFSWGYLDMSLDRKRLVGMDGARQLWTKTEGAGVAKIEGVSDEVLTFAVSPDGRLVAASTKSSIELVDVDQRRRLRSLKGLSSTGSQLAFSDDGRSLAISDADGGLRIWNVGTGAVSKATFMRYGSTATKFAFASMTFSADGKRIIARPEYPHTHAIDVWTVADQKLLRRIPIVAEGAMISGITKSTDPNIVYVGGYDGIVREVNLAAGRIVRTYAGLQAPTVGPILRQGARHLVATDSSALNVWDTETSALLTSSLISNSGEWITITPEGFFDASSLASARQMNVVNGLEIYSIDQVYQALYRPDLVREKLAGDPKGLVREAAAKLDLTKVIASGAAPRVSMVTPDGNVTTDEVTVEASIAEQNGGGIGRVEWRVNGVTLGVESRGLQRLPEGADPGAVASRAPVTVRRTLALEPGENRIEIIAYNGRDLIASTPARIVLKWDGEKSAVAPKLHVLTVGVNDYFDSRLKLSYAVPDAQALGEAMKQAGSSIYQSVEVTSVLDDKVTIENLDKVFAEVSSKIHPRDVFVFFLAGHGKTVDGRYHFLPQNFRYDGQDSIVKRGVDQDRFQAWFAKIPARKSILLYDTCESGSMTGERVQQRGIERVAALDKMTRAMGRTVLSASSDDAPALEGYRGHGVFTYALLDGMSRADSNGNGLIEVTELAAYIDQQVPEISHQVFKMRQVPQFEMVGNNFPIANKATVLQASAETVSAIPTKPTHVVISQSPVEVYAAAARGGVVVQTLPPGTTVTLIEGGDGWQLVAKDGRKLGFVQGGTIAQLQ